MTIIGLSEKGARRLPLIISWAVFIILSSAYLFVANAEYNVRVIDLQNTKTKEERRILHIAGDFDEGISNHIEEALNKYKVDEAVLYSPGGLGYEGYRSSFIFSQHQVNPRVARGTYCLSACAIAFVGGENYVINDGVLGFHKGWVPNEPWENQNEAFDAGQISGDYHSYFFVANGFSFELSSAINEHTDNQSFVVFTNEDDLNEFYVRTDGEDTPIRKYLEFKNRMVDVWGTTELISHLENNPNNNGDWEVKEELLSLNNITNEDS